MPSVRRATGASAGDPNRSSTWDSASRRLGRSPAGTDTCGGSQVDPVFACIERGRVGGGDRIAYVEPRRGAHFTQGDLDQGCLLQLITCLLFVLICPPLMLGCRIPISISTQPGPIGLGLCHHRSLACFGPSGGGIASGAAKRQLRITDMPAFAGVELTFISAALRALPNSGFSFIFVAPPRKASVSAPVGGRNHPALVA